MKGIVFDYKLSKLAFGMITGSLNLRGYLSRFGPLKIRTIPDPLLRGDDWVVIRTEYCGICGSDTKQAFLNGNRDNPITGLISFPQILGHEVVGTIERAGSSVPLKVGTRISLYPNISCVPRGLPKCKACQKGDYTLCRNYTKGNLAPGIHSGNSRDATGGFAELIPAHKFMLFSLPKNVTWQQGILADPFSVAFHSVLKVLPPSDSVCLVYGCGTLGLLTIQILKSIFTRLKVIAIARFPHQAEMAKNLGADLVINHRPTNKIVETIASYINCNIYYLNIKKPWLIEGVDFLFDTIASKETLEIGLRIEKARGTIIMTGVSMPKRFEWTPWYFKEINIIGCNAFGIEDFEGYREHAYEHYFRFLKQNRIDPSPLITHVFPLRRYKEALIATIKQKKYKSIKVVLSHKKEVEK